MLLKWQSMKIKGSTLDVLMEVAFKLLSSVFIIIIIIIIIRYSKHVMRENSSESCNIRYSVMKD